MNPPPSPLPPLPQPLPLSPITSCLSHCPLLDLSITADPAPKPRPLQHKPILQKPHTTKPCPQRKPKGKHVAKVRFEPAVAIVTPEPRPVTPPLSQQQPIRGQWRTGRIHETQLSNQETDPAAITNELPECPDGVELNTTLALKAGLQSLQEAQWDSVKAVKQTLDKNQRTQALINSRATAGVSFPRSAQLYSSLVSVQVPESHVIREAALQRIPLAPAPKAPPPPSSGPSLLPLTSDLYHQKPLPLSEPGPAPCLKPRPHSAPFSLYQRQLRWAASP